MNLATPVLRVWLNAGHGFSNHDAGVFDPGAEGCGYGEHAVVASIADQVESRFLLSEDKSVTVTATPDCSAACLQKHGLKVDKKTKKLVKVSHLAFTVHYLNEHYAKFDKILALHLNDSDDPAATGVEVFYANGNTTHEATARAIGQAVANVLGLPFRGAKHSGESQHPALSILDDTSAEAYLIELGFISNQADIDAVVTCGADAVAAAIGVLAGKK